MEVFIRTRISKTLISAKIEIASKIDMPLKKENWKFNWKSLAKIEGSFIYKLTTEHQPKQIEGLLMLSILNGGMVYLNNIEVAPHNYGSQGHFEFVAGCLIAFGCDFSFINGQGAYLGFVSFDSKTKLIPLYQQKYGATWIVGQKMFIDPDAGKNLIKKYLKSAESI